MGYAASTTEYNNAFFPQEIVTKYCALYGGLIGSVRITGMPWVMPVAAPCTILRRTQVVKSHVNILIFPTYPLASGDG